MLDRVWLLDPLIIRAMGMRAAARVRQTFGAERYRRAMSDVYDALLERR